MKQSFDLTPFADNLDHALAVLYEQRDSGLLIDLEVDGLQATFTLTERGLAELRTFALLDAFPGLRRSLEAEPNLEWPFPTRSAT